MTRIRCPKFASMLTLFVQIYPEDSQNSTIEQQRKVSSDLGRVVMSLLRENEPGSWRLHTKGLGPAWR